MNYKLMPYEKEIFSIIIDFVCSDLSLNSNLTHLLL